MEVRLNSTAVALLGMVRRRAGSGSPVFPVDGRPVRGRA